jgi:hypothetical protein
MKSSMFFFNMFFSPKFFSTSQVSKRTASKRRVEEAPDVERSAPKRHDFTETTRDVEQCHQQPNPSFVAACTSLLTSDEVRITFIRDPFVRISWSILHDSFFNNRGRFFH